MNNQPCLHPRTSPLLWSKAVLRVAHHAPNLQWVIHNWLLNTTFPEVCTRGMRGRQDSPHGVEKNIQASPKANG